MYGVLNALGVLAWAFSIVAGGWWFGRAMDRYLRLLGSRGILPGYAPGGLVDQAGDSPSAHARFNDYKFRESRRIWALSREPDSDPESELWRVRTDRRLRLVLIVALVGLLIPSAANVVPVWLATLSAATVAVQLLFAVGAVSMLAVFASRFAREAIRYGNGEAITLYRLLTPAWGFLVILILLGAGIAFPR
jgi:hypothetical protein